MVNQSFNLSEHLFLGFADRTLVRRLLFCSISADLAYIIINLRVIAEIL